MNKETMQQLILEALSKRLGDGFRITIEKVLKTNLELDGLMIMEKGTIITPTIYLEPYYEELAMGASIDHITDEILQSYSTAKSYKGHFDTASLSDFAFIKDRLFVALVNRHSNKKLLSDVPYAEFLDDFAITVRCMLDASEKVGASFLIHNGHLDMWQVDPETLISLALHNTRELLGVELAPLEDCIQRLCPELAAERTFGSRMWMATNKRGFLGASTALFEDVLRDFSKEHGNFYVVFSSVHEILLLLTPDDSDIESITRINQEVNATQVDADEVLGTKAYFYSRDKGFIL